MPQGSTLLYTNWLEQRLPGLVAPWRPHFSFSPCSLFVALVALVALVAFVADVLFYQKGRRQERNYEHKLLNAVRCMRSLDCDSDVNVEKFSFADESKPQEYRQQ